MSYDKDYVYEKDFKFFIKRSEKPKEHCLGKLVIHKDYVSIVSINPKMKEYGFFVQGEELKNYVLQDFMEDFVKLIGVLTLQGAI